MGMKCVTVWGRGIAGLTLAAAMLAGCAIDVDLSSTPSTQNVGQPVTFDVSVRNRTTCPVGGVIAVLVPFIPRNFIINQIPDPDLRAALSALVDAFCSGADVTPPDGAGTCRLEDGELICDLIPQMSLPGPFAEAAVATTDSGDDVTCASDGHRITCRFPHAVVEQAMAQAAQSEPSIGSLQCVPCANVAVCGALLLDPNETKTAQVQMTVTRPGVLHNWVVSFATVRGGVCTAGLLRNRPCSDDSDCPGMANTCGDGICVGGTRNGFGCDTADGNADCPNQGTCSACEVADDGQILSGVACTTTAVAAHAVPAASPWTLFVMAALLGVIGTTTIRRLRRE
jgi:hypothetical protein